MNDKELTARIQKEYAVYLKRRGINFSNNQGFYVMLPLKNTDHSFTHVCEVFNGDILLADYCGNCCSDLDTAVEVADAIMEKCPDCRIDVERYSTFQLTLYNEIKYDSIENLHKHVLRMAEIVDIGAGISRQMLGGSFDR